MNESNPYVAPPPPEVIDTLVRSLPATRRGIVVIASATTLWGVSKIVHGMFGLLTAVPPSPELNSLPLIPAELSATSEMLYRNAITGSLIQVATGVLLATAGFVVWWFGRWMFRAGQAEEVIERRFHRAALCGFAAASIGVVAYEGLVMMLMPIAGVILIGKCLTMLTFFGFGASVVALLLGRDLRIWISDAFPWYGLAVCGAGVSGYELVTWTTRFVRALSWQLQAFS